VKGIGVNQDLSPFLERSCHFDMWKRSTVQQENLSLPTGTTFATRPAMTPLCFGNAAVLLWRQDHHERFKFVRMRSYFGRWA
jgi:hypothetical protein